MNMDQEQFEFTASKKSAFSFTNQQPSHSRSPPFPNIPSSSENSQIFQEIDQEKLDEIQKYELQGDEYYCLTCEKKYNFKMEECSHKKKKNIAKQSSFTRRYKCDIQNCDRRFSMYSGLHRHKLTHTGEKPFLCDFDNCSQKFNQKSNLNRHKRIHKQQKPFICDTCCKGFTTTTNLKQHTQIHLEDRRKKFVCEIKGCNKQYLYMCNLKKHKQEHEDPMGECIGEKKFDQHHFSLEVGSCLVVISYKRGKNQIQSVITYKQENSAINYRIEDFKSIIQAFSSQQIKLEEEETKERSNTLRQLQEILYDLLSKSKDSISVCIQLHPQLHPIYKLVIGTLINSIGMNNLRTINLVSEQYGHFKQMVGHVMDYYEPSHD